MTVRPASVPTEAFFVGDTLRLEAHGTSVGGGSTGRISARWFSSDTAVATVSASGLVRAKRRGQVFIRAESGSRTALMILTVERIRCTDEPPALSLPLDSILRGAFTPDDCLLYNFPARGWTLRVTEPTTISWGVMASDNNVNLYVSDARFTDVEPDNREARGGVHQLRWTLTPGDYIVWLHNDDRRLGLFSARAREVLGCERVETATTLALDEPHDGALTDASCIADIGSAAERFALSVVDSTLVAIEISSQAFRPSMIQGWGSVAGEVETIGGLRNSSTRFVSLVQASASHSKFWVTAALSSSALGAFTATARTMRRCDGSESAGSLSRDTSIAGSISLRDCVFSGSSAEIGKTHLLPLAAPTTIDASIAVAAGGHARVVFLDAVGREICSLSCRSLFEGTERFVLPSGLIRIQVRASTDSASYTLRIAPVPM